MISPSPSMAVRGEGRPRRQVCAFTRMLESRISPCHRRRSVDNILAMRSILAALLLMTIAAGALQPATVTACPMCKVANEDAPAVGADGRPLDTNARPRAYMYSILFMLSMPVTLLSGFGIAFYRMTRRARLITQAPDGPVDAGFSPSIVPAKG